VVHSAGARWSAIVALAALLLAASFLVAGPSAEPAAAGVRALDRYVAPDSRCPKDDPHASVAAEQRTTLCLLDYARAVAGLPPLRVAPALMHSAELKAADIVRCNEFTHAACGFEVSRRFADAGYLRGRRSIRIGENLAWGAAAAGSPRGALLGWLGSAKHRANLLSPHWTEQGIAVVERRVFRGVARSRIWVSHFGRRG
jgi:uncharacterized protein YkwD